KFLPITPDVAMSDCENFEKNFKISVFALMRNVNVNVLPLGIERCLWSEKNANFINSFLSCLVYGLIKRKKEFNMQKEGKNENRMEEEFRKNPR
ncbi:hypothetical protein DERF_013963, partial [Dermatophagoides farinae]